ncbi:MAG: hypothetical protein JO251_08700 [Verrucomicrobia bacterium]|nr:hypothetical protein [Verrucomicrobiota bacterium]
MPKILHLFQFVAEGASRLDAEVNSAPSALKKSQRPGSLVLIPFRSPNDQQQLFAIRPSREDASGKPNFVDFND